MSFLETIACNDATELTDWLGYKIGELLTAHAKHMANTLPLMEEVPLHPFLATGLAKAILGDVNQSVSFELCADPNDAFATKDSFGQLTFPIKGFDCDLDLDELVKLARA